MSNEHWKMIAAGGIVISVTPEGLWEQAIGYFQWCDNNPIKTNKTMLTGKTQGQKMEVEYKRPYTIDGFCLHAGITKRYLTDIKGMYGMESPWYMVAEKILSVIYTQNLEGAIVDLFNPMVISKILNIDKPQEEDQRAVRVEIIDTRKGELSTNENDIMNNLDFNVVQQFKNKLSEEQLKEQSAQRDR